MGKLGEFVAPGEILLEEFMKPHQIGHKQLAEAIDVSAGRISDIIHGKCSINEELALRFSVYFATTA